jgi:hypothetical protein
MSGDRGTHAEKNSGACSIEKDAAFIYICGFTFPDLLKDRKLDGGKEAERRPK